MRKFSIATVFILLFFSPSIAQDSLKYADLTAMKYKAKLAVSEKLNVLLNYIANSENQSAEIDEVIVKSYSDENTKTFLNSNIIIEDDIDPRNVTHTNEHDRKVDNYLVDFKTYYIQSANPSVVFQNIRPSNPKRGTDGRIYVNVYYSSFFGNANKTATKPYSPNNRVASVRMEKKDNKWKAYIDGISFFNSEDTLNDIKNDIVLNDPNSLKLPGDSATMAADSIAAEKMHADEIAEANRQMENEKKAFDKQFDDLLEKGDRAKSEKDYNSALKYYKDAKDMKPLEQVVISRIKSVNDIKAAMAVDNEKVYTGFLNDAQRAEKNRDYQKAISSYNKAINAKPETAGQYKAKLSELNSKWQSVNLLEEKYLSGTVDLNKLIDEYDDAIKKNKDNSDLYLGRGRCFEKLGKYPKALKDYNQAYEMEHDNLAALKARADLYMNTNDKNDLFNALNDYHAYLLNDETNLPVYAILADIRLRINADAFDKAIEEVDNGLKVDPRSSVLLYKKGLLEAQKGDAKEALKSFTASLAYDSSNALAYYQRGMAYLNYNRINQASLDFANARQKGLDSGYIKNIEEKARQFYSQSVQRAATAKDSAMAIIDYAIAIDPANAEYHFKKGEYLIAAGKNAEAIESLNKATDRNQSFTEAWYRLGQAFANQKNYTAAISKYKNAISLDPKHFMSQKGLGDVYFIQKDYNNAAQNYEAFIATVIPLKNVSDPATIAEVYNSLGKSYFNMNETDSRAMEAYKNALKRDPNYAEAYFYRGLYNYKNKDLNNAITDMAQSVSLDNKHAGWYYQLAEAYREKKDFTNAVTYYKTAYEQDNGKQYPKALYLLGNCYYELQDFNTALPTYQKVQSQHTDAGISLFNCELGTIYLNLGKVDSGTAYINKAYQKDSLNATVMYAKATSLFTQGKKDESMPLFEKAFQSGQLNKNLVKNDKLIEALKDDKNFKALMKKYL